MYLVNRYDPPSEDGETMGELISSTPCAQWTDVVRNLRDTDDVTADAWVYPPRSLRHRVNNINGGELLILCAGSGGEARTSGCCPTCAAIVPNLDGQTADHAPGASDPYS